MTENKYTRLNECISLLGLKKNKIAEGTGYSPGSVGDMLNEKQPISERFIRVFCVEFGVSRQWLNTGIGEMRVDNAPRLIPVVSMANGGHDSNLIWEDAYPVGRGSRMIECPHDLKDVRAYAVELRGASMSPRYDEGEIVMVDTTKEVVSGSYAVVKLSDGEPMVKRVRLADKVVILESVNQSYEPVVVERKNIEFMHRITHKKEKA